MSYFANSILFTDAFWALIALIIFIFILIGLKVPKMLSDHLDNRAKNIAQELEDARKYKEEAKILLAECQQKLKSAKEEAENLLEVAHREARQISNDARQASNEYLERQKQLASKKIKMAQENAIKEIKNKAVELSVAISKEILQKNIDEKTQAQVFANSLSELEKKASAIKFN